MNRERLWWGIAGLSSVAIIVVVGAILGQRPTRASTTREPSRGADLSKDAGCELPTLDVGPTLLSVTPPVFFQADAWVEVSIDGVSPPPSTLTVGPHTLSFKSHGSPSGEQHLEARPFSPILLWVREDSELGVLVLRLGAPCSGCLAPLAPVALDEQSPQRVYAPLLRDAAEALRQDDWSRATRNLKAVPKKARGAQFHLLAATTYTLAGLPESALQSADKAAAAEPELSALYARWRSAMTAEDRRRSGAALLRWNALTDRFGTLLQAFEQEAPGAAAQASQRFESLGAAMKTAVNAQDDAAALEVERSGEQTLLDWVSQVRSAHEGDCAFARRLIESAHGVATPPSP
jgi:hypothetical protein